MRIEGRSDIYDITSNLSRHVALVRVGSTVFCAQIRGHHTERQVQPPRRISGAKQQPRRPDRRAQRNRLRGCRRATASRDHCLWDALGHEVGPQRQEQAPYCGGCASTVYITYFTDGGPGIGKVVNLAVGSTSQTVLPFTGLNSPEGVAVDAPGSVSPTPCTPEDLAAAVSAGADAIGLIVGTTPISEDELDIERLPHRTCAKASQLQTGSATRNRRPPGQSTVLAPVAQPHLANEGGPPPCAVMVL